MGIRTIAREHRLAVALAGLDQARSRATQFPATLTERQRGDHRLARRDSTKPQAVLASVDAISKGMGVAGAAQAAGGAYYSGSGGGGFGGGGGGEEN